MVRFVHNAKLDLSPSRKWNIFVANRVDEIYRLTETADWKHVPSAENPIDLLSCGLEPINLSISDLWSLSGGMVPNFWSSMGAGGLTRLSVKILTSCQNKNEWLFRLRFRSEVSWTRFWVSTRIWIKCSAFSYYLWFITKHSSKPNTLFVSHSEIIKTLHLLCRAIQLQAFPVEYAVLEGDGSVKSSSDLASLSPMIDSERLIKVGGCTSFIESSLFSVCLNEKIWYVLLITKLSNWI